MKALLICPAERSEVVHLAETGPLVTLVVYGKSLVEHWIDSLAGKGFKKLAVLASDRPEDVRASVGDGSRWGMEIEVIPESVEMTIPAAGSKYNLPMEQVFLLDTLPYQHDLPLFESYAGLFQAVESWRNRAILGPRIGLKEIFPGIWSGLHSQISPSAKLTAPCWIGDHVHIGPEAVIGPNVCIENNVVIETGAEINRCLVGHHTFIGAGTYLGDSVILGNTLINFRLQSFIKIRDSFLLSTLSHCGRKIPANTLFGRAAAAVVLFLTFPLIVPFIARCLWKGTRAFEPRLAVRPYRTAESSSGGGAVIYYELNHLSGWARRWPQLWNVVRGDFAWVGNRPLTVVESGGLDNDFERLWLAVPTGLIAHSDAVGCSEYFSDEGKAHASFYAARADWLLDLRILLKAFTRALLRGSERRAIAETLELKQKCYNMGRTAMSGIVSKIF